MGMVFGFKILACHVRIALVFAPTISKILAMPLPWVITTHTVHVSVNTATTVQ